MPSRGAAHPAALCSLPAHHRASHGGLSLKWLPAGAAFTTCRASWYALRGRLGHSGESKVEKSSLEVLLWLYPWSRQSHEDSGLLSDIVRLLSSPGYLLSVPSESTQAPSSRKLVFCRNSKLLYFGPLLPLMGMLVHLGSTFLPPTSAAIVKSIKSWCVVQSICFDTVLSIHRCGY